MAFDFGKLINAGKNPQPEANAGADALMQSMGASKGAMGTADSLMNNTDKQDMNDVKNVMSIFGGGSSDPQATPTTDSDVSSSINDKATSEAEDQDQMLAQAALGPVGMLLA